MKKVLLMLVAGAFISMTTVSCKKCGHCSVTAGGVTVDGAKLCSGDSGYDTYKSNCTGTGSEWKTD
jgi:hypothetical protein